MRNAFLDRELRLDQPGRFSNGWCSRRRPGGGRAMLGCGLLLVLGLGSPGWAALNIGWAHADITPPQPVLLAGQFHSRVSEGVLDPITATVLALESNGEHVVWVSCDMVNVADKLRDAIRQRLARVPGLDPMKVILHATHTHTAPLYDENRVVPEVPLPVMPTPDVVSFTAERIAAAVARSWETRTPGGIAYGLGHAVVGRNRRSVDLNGRATMYRDVSKPEFSHIEGFEDHNVNFLATYDRQGALTGLVVNLACPSQVSEGLFSLTADFWHETRVELKRRLGERVAIAAQCSTAGDIAPHFAGPSSYDRKPAQRMLELRKRDVRGEIARRIANAADDVLPLLAPTIEYDPVLKHRIEILALPMNVLSETDAANARKEVAVWRSRFESEQKRLQANGASRQDSRWYVAATGAYARMRWHQGVLDRFEAQKQGPQSGSAAVHVVRLGEVAFATNPFEYYLDYGIQIKARSPAAQTFLVQLAGAGTYVPSPRSVAGGGYGSMPASNPVGAEGGAVLRDKTLELINAYWE